MPKNKLTNQLSTGLREQKKVILPVGEDPLEERLTKKLGWNVDEEARRRIQEIARLYLEDDCSFEELGKKYGMNPTNLHKILNHRCGNTWKQKFRSKKLNIDEVVNTEIPPLLPENIIEKIRQKSKDRRTWDHKTQKHKYLFSRLIFDKNTGRSITGTTNSKGQRYYKPCDRRSHRYQINADVLEKAVTEQLFDALTNTGKLLKAVYQTYPEGNIVDELNKKLALKKEEKRAIEKKLRNYQDMIENFEGEDIKEFFKNFRPQIKELDKKKLSLNEEITSLEYKLNTLPDEKTIEGKRKEKDHKTIFWWGR